VQNRSCNCWLAKPEIFREIHDVGGPRKLVAHRALLRQGESSLEDR
jgi:hypothetical protein